ncbi:MAG: TraR/DksA C4-type zinc finger protein [Methanobacteriaceae archaeon]|nr:TraR/DksA C4-type zinc finger protein [Methanobacteriaceae archaeon]
MEKSKNMIPFSEVTKFHGHVCPGTAIGYRAGEIAINELGSPRAADEEFLAIVENDSCSVDAIQVLTGCTFGKGNLIFRDHGKHVYTFLNRDTGEAIRLSLKKGLDEIGSDFDKARDKAFSDSATLDDKKNFEKQKDLVTQKIMELPAEELFKIEKVEIDIPGEARLFRSVRCAKCGELVAEHRARVEKGAVVCIPCFDDYSRN